MQCKQADVICRRSDLFDRIIYRLVLNDPEEIIKQPQGGKPAVDGKRGERFFKTVMDVPIYILWGYF